MTSKKLSMAVVFMVIAACAAPIHAGLVNLNDVYNSGNPFMSDDYDWSDVVETNGPSDEPAFNYYQSPLMIGNTFVLNPTNFRVDVTPGPGLESIDSQLEMVIMGRNGATIPFLSFVEEGDFEVNGTNAEEATVTATVNYFYQVLEGTNVGATDSGTVSFSSSASPNDSGKWQLDFSFAFPEGSTKVRFEFDNQLVARATTDLSTAYIAKKALPGIRITVPEPSAIGLGLLGLLSLGFAVRQSAGSK